MRQTQAPLPWREGTAAYRRQQDAADQRDLLDAIAVARADWQRAIGRWNEVRAARPGTVSAMEHDSAVWAVKSGEDTYRRLMLRARELGVEAQPEADEPDGNAARGILYGVLGGGAIIGALWLAWAWGGGAVHGYIALGVAVAGLALAGRAWRRWG